MFAGYRALPDNSPVPDFVLEKRQVLGLRSAEPYFNALVKEFMPPCIHLAPPQQIIVSRDSTACVLPSPLWK